ncbi:Minor extracellular protease vpr [Trichoderma lentiforme]|uniref:Minor extracellular protease vpr n=1 Tax=Trichoderma lentiforme TaxID=1567552 RepID=A0A9P5CGH7_9HYPO|nr:Minor extracellular protease vpr [Trichoderma lentiforme]
MRFKGTLSSVLLFGLLNPVVSNPQLSGNGFVESRPSSTQNVTYIPNTYIVELEHTPSTKAASLFSQRLGGRVKYHVRKEFNNAKFFYGLSLTVTDGTSQKSDLLEISGVKNVWPVRLVPRPEAFVAAMPNLPSNNILPHIKGNSDVNRPLKMAGVDKLHEKGIKGKGVKIGIIDTGVDYLHPSLGGGFGPGYKISFGYDLVGDDYTGTNTPVPDDDPLVTCAIGGHGTHVAGIIGMTDAQNQGFGLVGVAPEATIGMYRVFGCSENSGDDVIMAAMQQAAEDGVDLITMSLGSLSYWEQASPYVSLAESIVESGVAIIAALGNDGDLGPYAVSAPGLAPEVLAVGSVENEVYPTVYKAQNNIGGSLEYISVFPFIADKPLTVFQAGSGLDFPVTELQAGGCDTRVWTAAQKAITDGANTAVLIYLTKSCSLSAYSPELSALNVTTVIYYTDDPDIPVLLPEPDTVGQFTVLFLSYEQSQQIVSEIEKLATGKEYTLLFNSSTIQDSLNSAGHAIDYFSSIGPTVEMTLKPQLSSPGGNILSTYPRSAGGYAVLSGTSMAAPFTAGVYALVKSQRPDLSIAETISFLQSTATPMKALDMDIVSSVTQQGSGLINAYAAVAADSQISPSQLSLLDSPKPAKQTITIKNTSKKLKTYSISHSGASYIRTFNNFTAGSDQVFVKFTNVHEAKYATAKFSKSKLSLQPGKSAKIEVQFTAPDEPQPYSEPIYSGHIRIATDSSSYVVPYLGVPYSRSDTEYIARNTTAWVGNDRPYVGSDSTSPGVVNIGNYSILGSDGSVPDDINVPIVNFIIVQPSNLIRLEIVPVNTTFVPTYYGFDPSVKFDVADVDLPLQEGFLGVPNYGIMAQWGIGHIPPGISVASLLGWPYPNTVTGFILLYPFLMHENGTGFDLTSGAFRPLLRVLRYGANGTSADDYESWLGPIMNVKTS